MTFIYIISGLVALIITMFLFGRSCERKDKRDAALELARTQQTLDWFCGKERVLVVKVIDDPYHPKAMVQYKNKRQIVYTGNELVVEGDFYTLCASRTGIFLDQRQVE